MNEQFINNLFQTSLYFFSSLLQADAAILGFGTVFIIFKLQSLDSIKQSIVNVYKSKGSGHSNITNTLLLSKDPKEIANSLSGVKQNNYDFKNYLYLILIPAMATKISTSIKWPVIVIGTHTIICALILFINQLFYRNVCFEFVILSVIFLWFAYGIFLAGSIAVSLLTKTDNYELKELRPDIYNLLYEKEK
jgi:hypothetical protein